MGVFGLHLKEPDASGSLFFNKFIENYQSAITMLINSETRTYTPYNPTKM